MANPDDVNLAQVKIACAPKAERTVDPRDAFDVGKPLLSTSAGKEGDSGEVIDDPIRALENTTAGPFDWQQGTVAGIWMVLRHPDKVRLATSVLTTSIRSAFTTHRGTTRPSG